VEKREWQVEPRLEHPLAKAMRKVDLFVPRLTADPTTKAADIVQDIVTAISEMAGHGPDKLIRESCITMIIILRLIQRNLTALNPLEVAQFGKTVSQALLAATEVRVQSQALQRAKDGR
jgi:hypothetical protein